MYRSIWEPELSEVLTTVIEADNIHDCNAIACLDCKGQVVGHIAKENSHILKA